MKEENTNAQATVIINSVSKILKGFKVNIQSLLYYFNTFEVATQDADKNEVDEHGNRFREVFASLGINVPSDKNDKEGLKDFELRMAELVEKSPKKWLLLFLS